MTRRMYWGIAVLIILLGTAAFFFIKSEMEFAKYMKETEAELAKYKEPLEKQKGHYHADGTFHHEEDPNADHAPSVEVPKIKPSVKPPKKTSDVPKPKPKKLYTGPLTFHAELLKTNPVKALRLQQEERGHWSAEWIPPFPTDDTEAQEFARANYLRKYYVLTFGKKLDTPEYEKEAKEFDKALEISRQMRKTIMSYPYGARSCDLLKLTWISLDTPPSYPGLEPSEYFGDAEARALLKQLGTWDY